MQVVFPGTLRADWSLAILVPGWSLLLQCMLLNISFWTELGRRWNSYVYSYWRLRLLIPR